MAIVENTILNHLGIDKNSIDRFRAVGIDLDSNEVYIRTRTGGNNRTSDGRMTNMVLMQHKKFIRTDDDDFDNTYAFYTFRLDPELIVKFSYMTDFKDQIREKKGCIE